MTLPEICRKPSFDRECSRAALVHGSAFVRNSVFGIFYMIAAVEACREWISGAGRQAFGSVLRRRLQPLFAERRTSYTTRCNVGLAKARSRASIQAGSGKCPRTITIALLIGMATRYRRSGVW
jgi:hypothetical protein